MIKCVCFQILLGYPQKPWDSLQITSFGAFCGPQVYETTKRPYSQQCKRGRWTNYCGQITVHSILSKSETRFVLSSFTKNHGPQNDARNLFQDAGCCWFDVDSPVIFTCSPRSIRSYHSIFPSRPRLSRRASSAQSFGQMTTAGNLGQITSLGLHSRFQCQMNQGEIEQETVSCVILTIYSCCYYVFENEYKYPMKGMIIII